MLLHRTRSNETSTRADPSGSAAVTGLDRTPIVVPRSQSSKHAQRADRPRRSADAYRTGWWAPPPDAPVMHAEMGKPRIAGLSISRSVSGILSGAVIHLGRPLPSGSCRLPGARRAASSLRLALHRVGLAEPPASPRVLVVSYTTVSPLPPTFTCDAGLAVCFLLRFPSGFPVRALPGTLALRCPDFPRRPRAPRLP